MSHHTTLAVYCSASYHLDQAYYDLAYETGLFLAQKGLKILYGGDDRGMMTALAKGATQGQGILQGVMPHFFGKQEAAKEAQSIRFVNTFGDRLEYFYHHADAFLVLPGGYGTLLELSYMLQLNQLIEASPLSQDKEEKCTRKVKKPLFLLDCNGFWDHLWRHIVHIQQQGFIQDQDLCLLNKVEDLSQILWALETQKR